MITEREAKEIVHEQINRHDPYWPEKPELVVVRIEETATARVLYYQSSAYLKSQNVSDALAGNGPYVVSKASGGFRVASTALPNEQAIQGALSQLQEESANG